MDEVGACRFQARGWGRDGRKVMVRMGQSAVARKEIAEGGMDGWTEGGTDGRTDGRRVMVRTEIMVRTKDHGTVSVGRGWWMDRLGDGRIGGWTESHGMDGGLWVQSTVGRRWGDGRRVMLRTEDSQWVRDMPNRPIPMWEFEVTTTREQQELRSFKNFNKYIICSRVDGIPKMALNGVVNSSSISDTERHNNVLIHSLQWKILLTQLLRSE
eukprot:CFRG4794T1